MPARTVIAAASAAFATVFAVAGSAIASPVGPVSTTPVDYTPHLVTPPDQNVRQLVQCGSTMYAVGTISSIEQGATTYSRNNAFSFSATTGAVTSWNPNVNGTVNSIALSADCSTAYLGGLFTSIHGTAVQNLASVSTSTGAVNTGFAHKTVKQVDTLLLHGSELIVGGDFTSINGSSQPYMASVNPTTGAVDSYLNLNISGTLPNYPTKVYNMQLSHAGTKLLVEGVFTSVAGQPRQQVFMVDLGANSATLDGWHSDEFNRACIPSQSFYTKMAAWSPDDSKVFTVHAGYLPASGPGSNPSDPRDGLCDSAAAFPATPTAVSHLWINYTGCDSLYSVVADANDVYIGGHERWSNNPLGCNAAGPGAVSMPGIGSINPTTGQATSWNPTRGRGHGAEDLFLTDAGLWVASDNHFSTTKCAGKPDHAGICFFPY